MKTGTKGTIDHDVFEFMCVRQEEAGSKAAKNKDCIKFSKEMQEIMVQIKKLIPTELYKKLDDLGSEIEAIELDYTYRQGFYDGMRFLNMQNEDVLYRKIGYDEAGGIDL